MYYVVLSKMAQKVADVLASMPQGVKVDEPEKS